MYHSDQRTRMRTQLFAVVFSILLIGSIMMPFAAVGEAAAATTGCVAGDSIQAAIDEASDGETICVEAGTYNEQLTIGVEGVTLIAADGHSPVLAGSGSGTGVHIDGVSGVTVEGFEIREYDTAVRVDASPDATITSNTVTANDWAIRDGDTQSHDMLIANNFIENNAIRGLSIQGSDRVQITGNHFEANGDSASGSGYGIYIRGGSGGSGVTIEANTIANHDAGVSIWTPDAVVRDNTISGHTNYGINLRTGLNSQNAHDAVIENNTFDNEGTNVQARSVRNTELRDNTFFGPGIDIDFEFVRDAVLTDNELTTGILLDGSTLSHFAYDASGNTIDGDPLVYVTGETNPTVPTDAGQVIVVDSTDVDVSGIESNGFVSGIQIAYSSGVTVTDNTVTNSVGPGIQLWESNGAVVENNLLSGTVLGSSTSDPAISIAGSGGTTIATNEISNTDGRALGVVGSPNAVIRENTLIDNRNGIYLSTADDSMVSENTITGTSHGGGYISSFRSAILVSNSEWVHFDANHIYGNAGNGIHDNRGQHSRTAVMTDNVITDNGNDGIYWRNSRDATFINNTVSNNDRVGINGPYGATVTENTVENNGAVGIDVSHESLVEANTVHANAGNGVMANNASIVRTNVITDNGGAGIFLRYFGYQTIEYNDVSGHDVDLIIYETEAVTVRDNTFETGIQLLSSGNPYSTLAEDLTTHSFSGNTVAGKELYYAKGVDAPPIPDDPGQVIVVNSTSVTVSGLEFEGVTAPIQIAFSDATITDNTVTDSTGSTISKGTITLWASDDALVRDNVVTGSTDAGLRVVESAGVEISFNEIVNNDVGVDGSESGGSVNATSNWWGAATGPSGGVEDPVTGTLADGDGDRVTENVQFEPWLTAETGGEAPEGTAFHVEIDETNSPVDAGEPLTVEVTVTNSGDGVDTQTIRLEAFDGTVVDQTEMTLDSGVNEHLTLTWETDATHSGTGEISVRSDDDSATQAVTIVSTAPIGVGECRVIDVPGTYELTADLTGSETCIEITASDVTFDGMGHTIGGVDISGSSAAGVRVYNADERLENVVVTNLTVAGWGSGVVLRDTDNSDLSAVTAVDGRNGIVLSNSNGNELVDVSARNNENRAVSLRDSNRNTLSVVEATDNEAETSYFNRGTIYLFDADHNTFEDVDVSGGRAGVRVSFSTGNSFTGVTTTDAVNYGIEVGSNGNEFDDVSAVGSGWHGIKVETASNNHFENVTVTDTDGSGIRFTGIGGSGGLPSGNVLENVTATDNDGSGISLSVANDNELRNVTLHSNAGTAVNFVSRAEGNLLERGEVDQGSQTAIGFGPDSVGNTVRDVTLLGTGIPFFAQDGDPNNVVERLDVGGTVVSVSARGVGTAAASPATTPPGTVSLGSAFGILPFTGQTTHVEYLRFHYEASDLEAIDEETLAVWRLAGEWQPPEAAPYTTGVDIDEKYVFANGITDADLAATFGVFAPTSDAELEVANAAVSTTEAGTGEEVTVTADAENVGTEAGPLVVTLEVDGQIVESETVELAPGQTTAVEFTYTFTQAGTYTVSVGGEPAGTVEVLGPFFDVTIEGTNAPVTEGEDLDVDVTIENTGMADGTQTVVLFADGSVDGLSPAGSSDSVTTMEDWPIPIEILDSQPVSLDTGDQTSITLSWTTTDGDVGDWIPITVASDNDAAGTTVTVEPAESGPSPSPSPSPSPELAFFDVTIENTTSPVVAGETLEVAATITNSGDADGTQTIELVADGTIVDLVDQSLEDGETRPITLSWATDADDVGDAIALEVHSDDNAATTTVTIEEVDERANVVLYGASVDHDRVNVDDTVTVTADLYNAGTVAGSRTVSLSVDGEIVDETTVTVRPGIARGGVELTWTPTADDLPSGETSMDVTLSLDGLFVDTVTVEHQYTDIQVIAASADADELIEGEHLSVVGSIYQAGTIDGPESIELMATHQETGTTEVVGSQEVTLSPGFYHLGAVNIIFEPEAAGTYELELGDRDAGTVTVEDAISDIQVIAASASTLELVEGEETHVVGSIYQAGNIEGTQEIELTATDHATGETHVVGSQEVTLSPGFYHLGAINISYVPDVAGTYDLELGDRNAGSIEVVSAVSDIQVIAASASDVELVEGEETHVIGSVYQAGTVDGPETIDFTVTHQETGDTEVVGSQDVSLAPGVYHLGALNVTFQPDSAGTYDLELGDRNAGTIEVEPAVSDITVVGASISDVELVEGEETHVVGSIYQAGTIEGTETIELTATHQETGETEVVDSQDATLAPGFYHLGALNVTFQPDSAGTYDLELGDRDAGSVHVEESDSDIQVVGASVSDVELIEGEETHVVGSIYQAGSVEGTETIELTATDQATGETEVVGSQEVTLAPGTYHLGALNITYVPDSAGTYELTLGDRDAGTVAVDEAITDIQVVGTSVSAVELIESEETHVVGSIYQAGNVEGAQEIELTATDQATGETQVVGSQTVSLAPGFYHLGAINITYVPDSAGSYELALGDRNAGMIEVEPAVSDIQVIGSSVSAVELIEGEETHVVGSIYQAGTIEGTETIELTATNQATGETEVVGSQDVTLSPGFYHLGAVNITYVPEAAGTYDLELGDRNAGTIEVVSAVSDIQVIAASASDVELVEGEETHVIGSIYQAGTIEGTQEIELTATNQETGETEVVGSQDATLSPGFYHLGAINVTYVPEAAGTYDLELGDRNAGTIEVEAAGSDITVVGASVSDVDLVEGETSHVVGSIYQAGNIDGPETIELTATDRETGETEVVGSQDATLSPGFYHLGALNVSYQLETVGTYDLELGDRDAGSVEVTDATVEPSIAAVEGHGVDIDLETGEALVFASDDATVAVDVDAALPIDEVTLLVESLETNYAASAAATHEDGARWTAAVPVEGLPDDGRYALSVVAVDERGNAGMDVASETLVIDRNAPSLSVHLEDVDSTDATVIIESDDSLSDPPTVSAEVVDADGSTSAATVVMDSEGSANTRFTGTLEFDESGEYTVTAVGTDRAGNEGTDTASVVVNTAFSLADGVITIEETGTTIEFTVADDADEAINTQELYIALSENTVNANLGGGEVGVGFLTADLDEFLDHHLAAGTIESATISMAIDADELATGVALEDVGLHHYDDATGEWNAVDSSVTQIGDDLFVVADVTHFSTYGALVIDDEPPVLVDASPADGESLPAGTDETTIRFEYDDHLSSIDVGSVSLTVDDTDVTGDSKTSITSTTAEYTLAVADGNSYDATVTVADEAGNEATFDVQFGVDELKPVTDDDDSTPAPDDDEPQDDSVPGFGIVLALAAVLVVTVIRFRRHATARVP